MKNCKTTLVQKKENTGLLTIANEFQSWSCDHFTFKLNKFINYINSRTPLRYRWSKSGNGNLPSKAYTQNFDRVLVIPNVQFTDEGTYTCHVQGRTQTESKDFLLTINGQFVIKKKFNRIFTITFFQKTDKVEQQMILHLICTERFWKRFNANNC